uniref:Coagulation factor XII n=1 Tax=Sphenodon punctatus TaxID=8508 RepID=A0A8D0GN72_SPHPU
CARNPCLNGGHCLELKHGWVCGCHDGFTGLVCDIDLKQTCYTGNGHLYHGTAQTTLSGAHCLPWDSPILLHELSSLSMDNPVSLGLGAHRFCRNPDNDSQPWCYILWEEHLSWEFCNITMCQLQTGGRGQRCHRNDSSIASSAQACGQRYTKSISELSRVVGGMVALPGAHPYLAALHLGEQFCGGSLIASCWVLTAAHCFQHRPDISQISVVLGQRFYNISTEGSVRLQVQGYELHKSYSEGPITHQPPLLFSALVRLKETAPGRCADFSHMILPVCLPNAREPLNTSTPCQIAGWGHLYEGASEVSKFLQEARLPLIPNEQCRSPEVHGTQITSDMLCAGYLEGGTDACQGDSGGPLVCDEHGRATLRGIVSWGTGCALENKPGVYTSVTHYLDWIQSRIG